MRLDEGQKITKIGGQALIEGVMMRGTHTHAISIRKPDGVIETTLHPNSKLFEQKIFKLPFVRGMFALISSMVIGVRALTYSASFYAEPEGEGPGSSGSGRFEQWLDKRLGKHADDVLMAFSIIFAFVFAILLFGVLPTAIVGFLRPLVGSTLGLSAIEGIIKIAFFITYIVLIAQMNDIKRVFQYHGAEHKTIHCFEHEEPVIVANARKYTTLHPRCGTSFLFFVLTISILLFTLLTWDNLWMRIGMKILLLPVVAGISYEIIRLAGRSTHPFVKALSAPGLMMQKLTTRQPDDSQLEVAIAAFKAVLETESETETETAAETATEMATDERDASVEDPER